MGHRWEKAVSVHVVRPYVIDVSFRDGTHRQIDLGPDLSGPVFEPLRDYALFRQAAVDPLGGSVFWPTGADLAPEFLYLGEEAPSPTDGAGISETIPASRSDAEPARTRG